MKELNTWPNSQEAKLRSPALISWEPKEDITAYELAQAMPYYQRCLHRHWMDFVEDEIEKLPESVRRHFVVAYLVKK